VRPAFLKRPSVVRQVDGKFISTAAKKAVPQRTRSRRENPEANFFGDFSVFSAVLRVLCGKALAEGHE
jgi:hypothetical protein